MNKILIKLVVCFVSIAVILNATSVIALATHSDNTIKVGYHLLNGYHRMNAETEYKSGYGYEYLQKMKVYTGHDYDYIGDDDESLNLEDMLDLLDSGDIDLLTSVTKTEERMEKFDFSDLPIGTDFAILVKSVDNDEYSTGDFKNWDGIRVGMGKGDSENEAFFKFAKENGFTYETVFIDSEQPHDELKNDSVDVILSNYLDRITKDETNIAKFNPSPFYVCVKKGNDELLEDVNNAISLINTHAPTLEEDLSEKYYSLENCSQAFFTAEEREFIAECQENGTVFSALMNSNQAPYSHYKDGNFVGINVEICDEIIARTGLNIKFIECPTNHDYIGHIETSEADILLGSILGYNDCEKYGYIQTTPYYNATIATLIKKTNEQSEIEVVALMNDLDYRRSIDVYDIHSDYEIIECQNADTAIKMVDDGDVDATFLFTIVAENAVRSDPKNSMVTTGQVMETVDFSIAVNNNQNTLLISILDKVSASMSNEDIEKIEAPYLSVKTTPPSVTAFVYSNPVSIAMWMIVILTFVTMVMIVVLLKKGDRRKEQVNYKLANAVSIADKANGDKSRFLAQMSHEIRTPMNAIIGLTSIAIAEIAEPEKVEANLNKIASSSRVLLRIINDILDMSAIEGGKLKLARDEFDFKKLIFDITTMFYQQTKEKNIEFNVKMESLVNESLIGDELRTQQVLMNLLSNAKKFTGTGGEIDLKIMQTSQSQDRVYIRYIVTDTGCGMPPEMLARLFNPFEQQDASVAKKHGGSGLGLSIAKDLTELMGGVIQAKSIEGEGSQFIVDIPYSVGTETYKTSNECFSKIRTLVVDSGSKADSYIGILLNRLLVPHDFVGNLDEALEMLEEAENDENPYKMCLLDWNNPEIIGAEFIQTIQEIYGDDGIVVMVIAYDLDEVKMDSSTKIPFHFIPKPLFQSTLVDSLMNLLGDSSAATSHQSITESYDFTGKTVLLVEDGDLNMEVATKILQLVNLNVVSAENGKIAIERYEESPVGTYDCILMDINMPVMDGYEATRVIRAMDRDDAKSIPIYAMTANAFSEDVKAALDTGMNGHIAKPIETNILYQILKKAIYGGL